MRAEASPETGRSSAEQRSSRQAASRRETARYSSGGAGARGPELHELRDAEHAHAPKRRGVATVGPAIVRSPGQQLRDMVSQ